MPGRDRTAEECWIGEWMFSPEANELRRGDERRRLEHRAARMLELLYRRRGAIVSREDILAEVWQSRAISENSVAVVIKDLRQALDDDARRPRHIETVSKRGYRLLAQAAAPTLKDQASVRMARRPRAAASMAVVGVVLAVLLAWVAGARLVERTAADLTLLDVENATGDPRYQPLAAATTGLIAVNAQQLEGVRVTRGAAGSRGGNSVTLSARLILWEGRPTLTMQAYDADGVSVWASMMPAEEALVPQAVTTSIEALGKTLHPKP